MKSGNGRGTTSSEDQARDVQAELRAVADIHPVTESPLLNPMQAAPLAAQQAKGRTIIQAPTEPYNDAILDATNGVHTVSQIHGEQLVYVKNKGAAQFIAQQTPGAGKPREERMAELRQEQATTPSSPTTAANAEKKSAKVGFGVQQTQMFTPDYTNPDENHGPASPSQKQATEKTLNPKDRLEEGRIEQQGAASMSPILRKPEGSSASDLTRGTAAASANSAAGATTNPDASALASSATTPTAQINQHTPPNGLSGVSDGDTPPARTPSSAAQQQAAAKPNGTNAGSTETPESETARSAVIDTAAKPTEKRVSWAEQKDGTFKRTEVDAASGKYAADSAVIKSKNYSPQTEGGKPQYISFDDAIHNSLDNLASGKQPSNTAEVLAESKKRISAHTKEGAAQGAANSSRISAMPGSADQGKIDEADKIQKEAREKALKEELKKQREELKKLRKSLKDNTFLHADERKEQLDKQKQLIKDTKEQLGQEDKNLSAFGKFNKRFADNDKALKSGADKAVNGVKNFTKNRVSDFKQSFGNFSKGLAKAAGSSLSGCVNSVRFSLTSDPLQKKQIANEIKQNFADAKKGLERCQKGSRQFFQGGIGAVVGAAATIAAYPVVYGTSGALRATNRLAQGTALVVGAAASPLIALGGAAAYAFNKGDMKNASKPSSEEVGNQALPKKGEEGHVEAKKDGKDRVIQADGVKQDKHVNLTMHNEFDDNGKKVELTTEQSNHNASVKEEISKKTGKATAEIEALKSKGTSAVNDREVPEGSRGVVDNQYRGNVANIRARLENTPIAGHNINFILEVKGVDLAKHDKTSRIDDKEKAKIVAKIDGALGQKHPTITEAAAAKPKASGGDIGGLSESAAKVAAAQSAALRGVAQQSGGKGA